MRIDTSYRQMKTAARGGLDSLISDRTFAVIWRDSSVNTQPPPHNIRR